MNSKINNSVKCEDIKPAKVSDLLLKHLRNLGILIALGFLLSFAGDLLNEHCLTTDGWRISDPINLSGRFFYEYCFMSALIYAISIILWLLNTFFLAEVNQPCS